MCYHLLYIHYVKGRLLPRPAPPPSQLQSKPLCPTPHHHPPTQVTCTQPHTAKCYKNAYDSDGVIFAPLPVQAPCTTGLMCWSYEEVHDGTEGFSPSWQVGEGGFGVVYKATLKNTIYAVKILKQVIQSQHRSGTIHHFNECY